MSVSTSDHVALAMRQAWGLAMDSQSPPVLAMAMLVVAVVPEQLREAAVTQTTRSRSVRTKTGS
jgi:hypothetical protein